MVHFFISYAKADTRDLALALADALDAPPDLTAWVDRELRATGSIWSRQIEREIQRCDYLVVLLSPDVNRSEDHEKGESFVLKEIEYMIQLKKERRIIVVMAQQTLVPLILTGKQYIDFTGQGDAQTLADRLCDELAIQRSSDRRSAQVERKPQAAAEAEQAQIAAERAAAAQAERKRVEPAPPTPAAKPQSRKNASGLIVLALGLLAAGVAAWFAFGPGRQNRTLDAAQLQTALTEADSFSGSGAYWRTLHPNGVIHTFGDGVPMALVPTGCFMMGSTDGEEDEQPVNEQCFDAPFWIDLTEVTQADFERLGGIKANPNGFDGDQRPVEAITWVEARDFCALRGARLPTEREWEYAARGPDNLVYPWGNTWNADNVVWQGNSNDQTANVGSRPAGASWVGALDMSGNVWEWVSSLYQDYPYSQDHESSSDTNRLRVLRGGSWDIYGAGSLRSADRVRVTPDGGVDGFGFRCARSS